MHLKPGGTNHPEPNANNDKPHTVRFQPRWCSTQQDSILTDVLGESRTRFSLAKHMNGGFGTKTSESLSVDGTGDKLCSSKEMPFTILPHPDEKCGDEQPYLQHVIPIIRPTMGEHVAPPTHPELVGHSIVCPTYQYADPYWGIVPPYVPQSLVRSHCLGVHPARMALPLEMTEEPVYVNAKQYHGILRRRQSRAKAELEKKLIKVRKPYLHESRHLHAMRRARGCGGRFLNTKKLDSDVSKAAPHKSNDTSSNLPSQYANNSSSGRSITNHMSQNANSSVGHQEVTESWLQGTNMQQAFANSNGNSCYPHHQGLCFSTSLPDNMLEEGDRPTQQHERIVANGLPHMALKIK